VTQRRVLPTSDSDPSAGLHALLQGPAAEAERSIKSKTAGAGPSLERVEIEQCSFSSDI